MLSSSTTVCKCSIEHRNIYMYYMFVYIVNVQQFFFFVKEIMAVKFVLIILMKVRYILQINNNNINRIFKNWWEIFGHFLLNISY